MQYQQTYEEYLDSGTEDGLDNEEGSAPSPFDWEAQADVERHKAEFPEGYF
jgi:hypothetical protein